MKLRNMHLVLMTLALVVMSCVLSGVGVAGAGKGAFARVEVAVEDVDIAFTDKKGKAIELGPRAVLSAGDTLDRFKSGYLQTALKVEVTNKGALPVTAEQVDYAVTINDVAAGKGTFPGKGKSAVTLTPGEPYKTTIKLKTPTKKVLKGGDLSKLIRGGELTFHVTGTARGSSMGLTAEQPFDVTEKRSYP